jgi:hypothetical protein
MVLVIIAIIFYFSACKDTKENPNNIYFPAYFFDCTVKKAKKKAVFTILIKITGRSTQI